MLFTDGALAWRRPWGLCFMSLCILQAWNDMMSLAYIKQFQLHIVNDSSDWISFTLTMGASKHAWQIINSITFHVPTTSPANNEENESLVVWPCDQKQQHLEGVVAKCSSRKAYIERYVWATAKEAGMDGCSLTMSCTQRSGETWCLFIHAPP